LSDLQSLASLAAKGDHKLKVEVLLDGKWVSNSRRYKGIPEAVAEGQDLFLRWGGVEKFRIALDEPEGFKVVDPPANPERRKLLEGDDLGGIGPGGAFGAESTEGQHEGGQ
jgi:hypothetical protein